MLEVQVSPNDLGKAEEILKKQSPSEAVPSETPANFLEISMNEREAQMIQQRLEDVDIRYRLQKPDSGTLEILVADEDQDKVVAILRRAM